MVWEGYPKRGNLQKGSPLGYCSNPLNDAEPANAQRLLRRAAFGVTGQIIRNRQTDLLLGSGCGHNLPVEFASVFQDFEEILYIFARFLEFFFVSETALHAIHSGHEFGLL